MSKKANNPVITAEQAKAITGGRTPLLPAEYEAAVKALDACLNIDEAKYWDNFADIAAAWAKINRNNEVARKAAQFKLKVYRRLAELAKATRPQKGVRSSPGAVSLLKESGFKKHQADSAMRLAALPKPKFEALLDRAKPPSPNAILETSKGKSDAWNTLVRSSHSLADTLSFARRHDPARLARLLSADEGPRVRAMVRELGDWLDELEQHLPKERKK